MMKNESTTEIKRITEIKSRPTNARNKWYVMVEYQDGKNGPRMLDVSQFTGLCLRLRSIDPTLVPSIPPDNDLFAMNFGR